MAIGLRHLRKPSAARSPLCWLLTLLFSPMIQEGQHNTSISSYSPRFLTPPTSAYCDPCIPPASSRSDCDFTITSIASRKSRLTFVMPHALPTHPRQHVAPKHTPQRPPLTPNQSRYLTINQHKRIDSWRSLTEASMQASSPRSSPYPSTSSKCHSNSTGAAHAQPGDRSSPGVCPVCDSPPACSCSTCSPRARAKGYYKKSKKKSEHLSASGQVTSHPSSIHLNAARQVLNKNGRPNSEQIEAYHVGAPLPPQFGAAPIVPLPEALVAVLPAQAPTAPRIASARDPISQN